MNSSKGDATMAFHYDDSLMHAAVGDINYIAESIVLVKSKRLYGKSVGLKISNLMIVQYIDDMQLATK